MTVTEVLEEAGLKVTKYPHLRLLSGGGNPPENGGINWLNGLPQGTAFTCKKNGSKWELELFIVAFKYQRSIVLVDAFNQGRFAIDPEEWCKRYTYWETIGREETGIPSEGENDGSEGTVQSGTVGDDAGPPTG